MACTAGAPTLMTEDPRAYACSWEGLSRKASLGALSRQRISYRDRDDPPCVVTEILVSRQGVGQQGLSVSQHSFGVVIGELLRGLVLGRDMTLGVATTTLQCEVEACCDIVFFVAIGFDCLVPLDSLGVATGPGLWAVSRQERAQCTVTERLAPARQRVTASALRKRQACNSALCCALFGSLFMGTIHEHCSWALF